MQPRLPGLRAAPGDPVARLRREVDATVTALRAAGRLERVDAARVAIARTLAELADAEIRDPDGSRWTAGMLTGRLREAVGDLFTIGAGDDDDTLTRDLHAALAADLPPEP